jgi:hypothetical protein
MADAKRKTMFPPIDLELFKEPPLSKAVKRPKFSNESPNIAVAGTTRTIYAAPDIPSDSGSTIPAVNLRTHKYSQRKKPVTHKLKQDNPWSSYRQLIYTSEKCDVVAVYDQRKRNILRSIVRVHPKLEDEWIHDVLGLDHKHLVRLCEAFQFDDTFLVYEMMDLSLETVVACLLPLREPQVARICAKVGLFDHKN